MAYPLDTSVETAISTIEAILNEDVQTEQRRHAVFLWRELLSWIERQPGAGYDALTQQSYDGLNGA